MVTVVCLPRIALFTAGRPFNLPSESETGFTVNRNLDLIIECLHSSVYHVQPLLLHTLGAYLIFYRIHIWISSESRLRCSESCVTVSGSGLYASLQEVNMNFSKHYYKDHCNDASQE